MLPKWFGPIAAALALSACAARLPDAPNLTPAEPATSVAVTRDGEAWTAEFRFVRASPVWAFSRSATQAEGRGSWRTASWTVETPGVRLERRGHYDVFVGEQGPVPAIVRIRFVPFTGDLETSYDPAIAFTDGSVALFDGQFDLFPVAGVAEAERLSLDRQEIRSDETPVRITFRDARGALLHAGERSPAVTLPGTGEYVLFGPATPIVTEAMSAIIDPGLPSWLRTFLGSATPEILARYATQLGPPPGPKPTIIVGWSGPTPRLISMGGSVLPGLITMRFEGEGVVAEHAGLRNQARWFVAHEGAHFWLGQAMRYESSRDSWITEGGAELLAVRTVAALDPAYDVRGKLQELLDECIQLAGGRAIESARERDEFRAYYGCGAMFALVAEATQRRAEGGGFASFVRTLIDANRADGVLTRDEWLAELTRLAGDAGLEQGIRAMLETGVSRPAEALAALFERAGIAFTRGADGQLLLS